MPRGTIATGVKKCTRCNRDKPLAEFRQRTGTSRYYGKCRQCEAEAMRGYRHNQRRSAYFKGRSCAPPGTYGRRGCMFWNTCKRLQVYASDAIVPCERTGALVGIPEEQVRDTWLADVHEPLREECDPLADTSDAPRWDIHATVAEARRASRRGNGGLYD